MMFEFGPAFLHRYYSSRPDERARLGNWSDCPLKENLRLFDCKTVPAYDSLGPMAATTMRHPERRALVKQR